MSKPYPWTMGLPDPEEFARTKEKFDKLFAEYRAANNGRSPSLEEALTFRVPID